MQSTRLFTVLLVALLFSATAESLTAQTITHVPLYTFNGDSADDFFGGSVSGAGDVNGDGFADLIVGAIDDDDHGTNSGSTRVFSGIDGSVLYNFHGDGTGDRFGRSVSGAGDVNGDGRADLFVGAWDGSSASGCTRVFSGIDGSVLYNFHGLSEVVSGAGDVNGDGRADLIVGAGRVINSTGSARVLSGINGSPLYTFNGDSTGDFFGGSVSGAGDVNGDGFADLIVGASGDDNNGDGSGSARVLSGSDGSVLYTFNGDSERDRLGGSVSGAGDVNGDGMADLIVTASGDNSARVLSGSDGSTLYNFHGGFGLLIGRVSSAGDVNGDGMSDLIVGLLPNDELFLNSGRARVLSGIDGSVLYNFGGDFGGDLFGISVSCAGDVNGDGIDDFIVGSVVGGANGGGYARVFVSQISVPICTLGDVDLSGNVDFLDIAPFIAALSGGTNQCEADCDQSGMVDFLDIQPFIEILSSP